MSVWLVIEVLAVAVLCEAGWLDGLKSAAGLQDTGEVLFLPIEVNGAKVLVEETKNHWRVTNSDLKSTSEGVGYRRSKSLDDKVPDEIAFWDFEIDGVDEGDGWVRCKAPTTITEKEAIQRLKGVGAELSLPGFQDNMSLLTYAFSNQSLMPSPSGSLAASIKVVSTTPYVLVIDDFLTDRECDFLRALGINRLKPAMVVQNGDNWYDTQTQTRNNEQVWLTQSEEREVPILRHIMKRMHRTARIPDEYAEALQIGRYKAGNKYEGHVDSDPPHKVARPTTMLSYLNDVEEGGDTLFPLGRSDCGATWRKHPKTGEKVYGAAVCCETPENDAPETVRVQAKKGRVVIFYSHLPDGQLDQKSQHIGCPVIQGEKWIAQRWLRFEPYNRVNYAKGAGWDSRYDGIPPDELRESARDRTHMRVISQMRPKLFLEEHLLNKEEITQLLSAFKDQLAGQKTVSMSREDLDKDVFLSNLTDRAHIVARFPSMETVALTVKRISQGESEAVHMDSVPPDAVQAVTVSVYFSVAEDGGELFFPDADRKDKEFLTSCNEDLAACCAQSNVKLRTHRGDAVLLFSYDQRGRLDETSKHGHCPIAKGEHWIAEWRFLFEPEIQGAPASKPLDTQPKVHFENHRSTEIEIFWSAPHGASETSMGSVEPGGEKELNSYSGHVFLVRDEVGALVDKFNVGQAKYQRFIIPEKQEL